MNSPFDQLRQTVSETFHLYLIALPDARRPEYMTAEMLTFDVGSETMEIDVTDATPIGDLEMRQAADNLRRQWKVVMGTEPFPTPLWSTTRDLRDACGYASNNGTDVMTTLVTAANRLVTMRTKWLDAARRIPDLHFYDDTLTVTRLDGEYDPLTFDSVEYFGLLKDVYTKGPVPTRSLKDSYWSEDTITRLYTEKNRLNKQLAQLRIEVASMGYRGGYIVRVTK